jgi:cephalosporin hydroxylase
VNIDNALIGEKAITELFHKCYYNSQTWLNTYWQGVRTQKCPFDLWVYQEIIYSLRPSTIIECGTSEGGSALFLASVCDLVNKGRIITIDIKDYENKPQHNRIRYLLGSSTSQEIVRQVSELVNTEGPAMVILDTDHHKEHVLKGLRTYCRFVTQGSYVIVEDTNINGHPVLPEFGPGPSEAVADFLRENDDFVVDRTKEKFLMTFNPGGYLRRVKRAESSMSSSHVVVEREVT